MMNFDACKSNAKRPSFEHRCKQGHHERKSFYFFWKTSKILPMFGWISISVVEFKTKLRLMNDDSVQNVSNDLCHSKKVHHYFEKARKLVQNSDPQMKKISVVISKSGLAVSVHEIANISGTMQDNSQCCVVWGFSFTKSAKISTEGEKFV